MTRTKTLQTKLRFNPRCHHLLAVRDLGHDIYFTALSIIYSFLKS